MSHHKSVHWLKTSLSLALAAFWPLVASHCNLEQVSNYEFLACGPQADPTPHEENDCHSDGCAVIEAGLYKVEERQATVQPPMLVAVVLQSMLTEATLQSASIPFSDSSPPELQKLWQFHQRAAAPPRAPSFVS